MRGKVDGDAEEGIEGAVHEGSSESGQPDGVENKLAESCGFGDDQKGDGGCEGRERIHTASELIWVEC